MIRVHPGRYGLLPPARGRPGHGEAVADPARPKACGVVNDAAGVLRYSAEDSAGVPGIDALPPIARIEMMVRPDPAVDLTGHAVDCDAYVLVVVRRAPDRKIEVRERGESECGNGHQTH